MTTTKATELVKLVKIALVPRYGYKNVSVQRGRGTASFWVYATVHVPKSKSCYCKPTSAFCGLCSEMLFSAKTDARAMVYSAMALRGMKFSTYTVDDLYDTLADCFILDVRFIHPRV